MFPNRQRLEKMLVEAMQENAPKMYARLRKAGKLGQWASERAQSAVNEFSEQMSLVSPTDMRKVLSAQKEGYLATVQAWSRREQQISESALANALEFPPENETTPLP